MIERQSNADNIETGGNRSTQHRIDQHLVHRAMYWGFLLALAYITVDRLQWILGAPYPLSSDAYFYLQEIKHRATTGSGYYVGFSPLLWLMGMARRITGISDHSIFNLAVITTLGLMSFCLWALCRRANQRWLAPALLFTLLASDLIFFRQYAFLKQAFGISLVYCAVLLLETGEGSKTLGRDSLFGLLSLLVAALSHVFAAIFAATLGFSYGWRKSRLVASTLTLLVALPAIVYLRANPKPIFASKIDSLTPTWVAACNFTHCSSFEWAEFTLFFVFSILVLVFSLKDLQRQLTCLTCSGLCLLCYFPIWTDVGHMSFRLALSTLWILPLALAIGLLQSKTRSWSHLLAAFCLIFVICKFSLPSREYTGPDMPTALIANNAATLQKWIPEDAFILAPHGLQFRLTYFLNRSSATSLPQESSIQTLYHLKKQTAVRGGCAAIDSLALSTSINDIRCLKFDKQWIIRKLKRS